MPIGLELKGEKNKEKYKGLFKLFLQWSNCVLHAPLVCLLAFAQIFAVVSASEAKYLDSAGNYRNVDSGTAVKSVGVQSALPKGRASSFNLTYFRAHTPVSIQPAVDTQYGVVGRDRPFIKKPFAPAVLGQKVREVLEVV